MKYTRWLFLLVPAVILPFLVWAYDRTQLVYSIGHIDLRIEYLIMDSTTGRRIPAARLDFQDDEGIRPRSFGFIIADAEGHAQHEFPASTISTQSSGLNWSVHHAVYVPSWSFTVTAPGYIASKRQAIEEYRRETRVENRRATLTIPVRLEKE